MEIDMLKLGTETGSLINHVMSRMTAGPDPVAGDPATVLHWSDRDPATVVHWYAKNGSWVQVYLNNATGRWIKCKGSGLVLGRREKYRDPSF